MTSDKPEAPRLDRAAWLFGDAPWTDSTAAAKEPARLSFKFEEFARTLADLALNPGNQTPFTVVVRGDWGRGKTTLLRRTRALLDAEGQSGSDGRPVKTLWFNAWKYPQEDGVLAGLLGEMIDRLREGGLGDQLAVLVDEHKEWLARTVLRVPLQALLKDKGADFRSRYQPVEEKRAFYDQFARLFGELSYIWFNRRAASRDNTGKSLAAIAGSGGPAIAIFLDDLDRCRQERIVDVLEAINLFLDQPGVCFYLGLSWERLLATLKVANHEDPEQFLEKIVQVAFDLPEVSEEGASEFIDTLIRGTPLAGLVDAERDTVSHVLASRHPRHVKRFLNDLSIRLAVLRNTGDLGEGPAQITESVVLSWHLLLESLPAARRREVTLYLGNLEKLLQEVGVLGTGDRESQETVTAEVAAAYERKGLPRHVQAIAALERRQRTLLINLGSPPRLEAPAPIAPTGNVSGAFTQDDIIDPASKWWVSIPAGGFRMGSDQGAEDERPAHPVRLTGFEITRYPVTNAQYSLYLRESGSPAPRHWEGGDVPAGKEDHPVVRVSWPEAVRFCEWLSKQTDRRVELPTEAQWEFAARGPGETPREYPWGKADPAQDRANFGGLVGDTTPVATYPKGATPEGVCDLAGNVWEWCRDWYVKDGYQKVKDREETDPTGPPSGTSRVLRGGAFGSDPRGLRGAGRSRSHPEYQYDYIGFRCVRGGS